MKQVIDEDRKRRSERQPAHDFAGERIEGYMAEANPLKPYRSEAERTRVRQGWMLIGLNLCTIGLIVYSTFIR